MTTNDNATTLQALLQFALPLGTTLVSGTPDSTITWAVTVRARPPAFPEIHGGELALVSMEILRSYDSRISLNEVIESLAKAGVHAVVTSHDDITKTASLVAKKHNVALLSIPQKTSLTSTERAINKLIINQSAQLTQRAIEIQRQLSSLAAENRDLNSLVKIMARATAKPIMIHDEAGVLITHVYPHTSSSNSIQSLLNSAMYRSFQNWISRSASNPQEQMGITPSPIGFTIILKVEKRIAGYLSLVDSVNPLNEFDRLVITYGSDVCAIELAKNKAIASAVEQTRGDWIQTWLSGTTTDEEMLIARALQSGFDIQTPYALAIIQFSIEGTTSITLDAIISHIRDDMRRRNIEGVVGQNVDVIVILYTIGDTPLNRVHMTIEDIRHQLENRHHGYAIMAGLSQMRKGLTHLREAYREAKDAIRISTELGDVATTTYYGDLRLYQLLLGLKENSLEHLKHFYNESLAVLVEHDERKQGDLIRTLTGFFESNGNLAKAANDLDVHRNTLVYRLERISELTGLDLDDADNRLILSLALKIRRVLATLSSEAL